MEVGCGWLIVINNDYIYIYIDMWVTKNGDIQQGMVDIMENPSS